MNTKRLDRIPIWLLTLLLSCALLATGLHAAEENEEQHTQSGKKIPKTWLRVEKRTNKIGKQKTNRQKGTLRLEAEELVLERRRGRPIRVPIKDIEYVSRGYLGIGGELDWVILTMAASHPVRTYAVRDGGKLGFGKRTDEIEAALRGHLQAVEAAQYRKLPGFVPYLGWKQRMSFQRPETWIPRSPRQEYEGTRLTLATVTWSDPAEDERLWFDGRVSPKGANCRGTRTEALENLKTWLTSDWWGPKLKNVELTPGQLGPCELFRIEAGSELGPVIGRWVSQGDTSFLILTHEDGEGVGEQILDSLRIPAENDLR